MKKYPIAETFLSFQGEGLHCGRKAFFVRLFGCNVKCPWCDSKYAWNGSTPEYKTVDEIVAEVEKSKTNLVVITGGEPCLFDLRPLLKELLTRGIECNLETSGTLPIIEADSTKFTWVALSPKLFMLPLEENLIRADELKMIVSTVDELPEYAEIAKKAKNAKCLWLEPEWSKAQDVELLRGIADFVINTGGKFRCGWQMHKNYFVR